MYLVVIILILIVCMWNGSMGTKQSIQKLVKQSARYATTAQQDTSPMTALLHANYAVSYLNALKDIATDNQIHNATGIDVKKFKEHIMNVQDMVTKKTSDTYPEIMGHVDMYLTGIGGLSA